MHALPQADALEVALETDPAHWRPLLNGLAAQWFVSADGVAHGKSVHAPGGVGHTGSLLQALGYPRCPSKGCMSPARLAGPEAAEVASLAQVATGSMVEVCRLERLCATDHAFALWSARSYRAAASPGDLSGLAGARLEAVEAHVLSVLQEPSRLASTVEAAARLFLMRAPSSPVREVRDALSSLSGVDSWSVAYLSRLLEECDGSSLWAARFSAALKVVDLSAVRMPLPVLDKLSPKELSTLLEIGVAPGCAAASLWLRDVLCLVDSIPLWWSRSYDTMLSSGEQGLVLFPPSLAELLGVWDYEVFRLPSAPLLLLAPIAVVRAVTEVACQGPHLKGVPVPSVVLDCALSSSELETLGALVSDAVAASAAVELDVLVAAACAL